MGFKNKIMSIPVYKNLDSCYKAVYTGQQILYKFYNVGIWKENHIPSVLEKSKWEPEIDTNYLCWWYTTNPADPSDPGIDILVYIEYLDTKTEQKYANIKNKFTINKDYIEPGYEIKITMDCNDADYMTNIIKYSETAWNEEHPLFFYMISYLSNGYSGKFSNGEMYGNYYGHHFAENAHGLDFIYKFVEYNDWLCYNSGYPAHSFTRIEITHIDSQNNISDVNIPCIDDMFETKEEMIDTLNELWVDYCVTHNIENEYE